MTHRDGNLNNIKIDIYLGVWQWNWIFFQIDIPSIFGSYEVWDEFPAVLALTKERVHLISLGKSLDFLTGFICCKKEPKGLKRPKMKPYFISDLGNLQLVETFAGAKWDPLTPIYNIILFSTATSQAGGLIL